MDDNTLLTLTLIWHLIAKLHYCSDKKSTTAWARGGWGGGRKRKVEGARGNSCFNVATDKKSEWIQPTWTPQPGSPYLFFPTSLHPSSPYLELQISPCVSLRARWEIRREVRDVSAIWACCSFRFICFISDVYLSLCHWVNVWFLVCVHMNVKRFLLVKRIKMDGLFMCVICVRLGCVQAWIQGLVHRNHIPQASLFCVCFMSGGMSGDCDSQ